MKPSFVASLAVLFLLAARPVQCQDQPARSPEAVALLAQCAATMGTPLLQDVLAEGAIVRADGREPARSLIIKSKGADRVRNEITSADRQETYVVNRGRGHEQRGSERTAMPAQATAFHRPEHAPALVCQVDLARSNMRVLLEGQEQVGSRLAYHIRFVAEPRSERKRVVDELTSDFHVFLDAETLVVLKTRSFIFAPDAIENHSTWEVVYSDYRLVGGVLMPFRIERFDNGQKLDEIVFTNVRVNVGVADSEFE